MYKKLCSNQPNGNEGFVFALDATSWRDDASLVQVFLRLLVFSLTSQWMCLAATTNSLK
jgi:hypothetical protein